MPTVVNGYPSSQVDPEADSTGFTTPSDPSIRSSTQTKFESKPVTKEIAKHTEIASG
jgi:hypothetical protein